MVIHILKLWNVWCIFLEFLQIAFAQFTQLLLFVQHISNVHGFLFGERNRNDVIPVEILWKNTAGNGISVQTKHKVDNRAPVIHANFFLCRNGTEQLLGKINGFILSLNKIKARLGGKIMERDAFLLGQRMVLLQKHMGLGRKQFGKDQTVFLHYLPHNRFIFMGQIENPQIADPVFHIL